MTPHDTVVKLDQVLKTKAVDAMGAVNSDRAVDESGRVPALKDNAAAILPFMVNRVIGNEAVGHRYRVSPQFECDRAASSNAAATPIAGERAISHDEFAGVENLKPITTSIISNDAALEGNALHSPRGVFYIGANAAGTSSRDGQVTNRDQFTPRV